MASEELWYIGRTHCTVWNAICPPRKAITIRSRENCPISNDTNGRISENLYLKWKETFAHTGIGARSGPEDISWLVEEVINALWRRSFICDRDMKWWSRAFGDRWHYRWWLSDHSPVSFLPLAFCFHWFQTSRGCQWLESIPERLLRKCLLHFIRKSDSDIDKTSKVFRDIFTSPFRIFTVSSRCDTLFLAQVM